MCLSIGSFRLDSRVRLAMSMCRELCTTFEYRLHRGRLLSFRPPRVEVRSVSGDVPNLICMWDTRRALLRDQ